MTDLDQDLPAGLDAVAQHARDLSHAPVSERMERLGRERLVLTALHARPRVKLELSWLDARSWRWLAGSGAALVVVCLLVGGLVLWRRGGTLESLAALSGGKDTPASPLTYQSYGGQPSAANYLVAPIPTAHPDELEPGTAPDLQASPVGLRFSDGSEIKAAPGARLRVDSTQSRGARVFLEQGKTRTHIEHGANSSWVFVAGPFDVHVTGTTFNLEWDASTQAVDLELIEGSVSVSSPLGPSQIEVKTGQRFRASMLEGTMQLESADSAHVAGFGGGPAPSLGAVRNEDSHDTQLDSGAQRRQRAFGRTRAYLANGKLLRAKAHARRQGQQEQQESQQLAAAEDVSAPAGDSEEHSAAGSFSDLMRAGAFAKVVELATAAGLSQTLERGSADDVRALADAARYLHRTELAVRSLTVLRARFPGTHHGTAAAFLLGRTYENATQLTEARRFYELYLRETPRGGFAAEALAGRMRMVAAQDGSGAARPIAEEYLKRFPRGVHAAAAQRLAQPSEP